MNKKNGLLLGCLALLLVLSVGYALFSETITINGTATAKGSFDIIASCNEGVNNEIISALGISKEEFIETGFSNGYCDVIDNKVDFGADLAFPGASRYFTITLTNNGTIPAKINKNTGIEDNVKLCENGECRFLKDDSTEEQYSKIKRYYFAADIIAYKDSNGNYISTEGETSDFIDSNTGDIILDPKESIVVLSNIFWHEKNILYPESTNYGDFQATGIIDFHFSQVVAE